MSKDRVRKKSTGMFGLVTPKAKQPVLCVRNPTSYIELAIQEVGIPLTVKLLENGTNGLQEGDILTIHSMFQVPKLECVKPNGWVCEIPLELPCRVKHIAIDNSTTYHTASDVLKRKKQDGITWIVVTKPFVYQAFVYNPGLIFEVLNEDNSNESDTLSVEVHPGRLLVFLPVQIRGEFKKCNSPYFESECELSELGDVPYPYFITPITADINKLYNQHIEMAPDRLFVRNKKNDNVLIASTNSKETEVLLVHAFPVDFPLKCEILLGGVPVDIFTNEELEAIQKKLVLCDQEKLKNHITMSYEHVGIKRSKSKRNGRLKKKDIRAPQALENTDYARYIQKPTDILKELNLNFGSWGGMNTTTTKRSSLDQSSPELSSGSRPESLGDYSDDEKLNKKKKRKSKGRRSIYSFQFEKFSVEEVVDLFCSLSLEEHSQTIRNEQINGQLLTVFDVNDFLELGLHEEGASKLWMYINGSTLENKTP